MGDTRVPLTRRLAGLGAAAAAALAMTITTALPPATAGGSILGTDNPNAIPGSYMVIFTNAAAARADDLTATLAARHEVKISHTYRYALHGFAGTMSESAASALAGDPSVAYVEQNATVSIVATQTPTPSWGLDRIDQRDLPLDNSYTYPNTASNVRAYIIDTGIRITHTDLGGRAVWGTNTVGDGIDTDCHGHGTHVSGTVGGSTYGVAKGIQLTAVKVLGCGGSGTFAGVAAGIDWVTGDHAAGAPAVANMSLGAAGSDLTTENAVRNSIADGVVYAIASGNSNSDACNFTPARVAEAITVNASDITDTRASFSNFGTCTDIFGPGVNITSAWNTDDNATNTISGTSMATPHTTGTAALILGANPTLTPAQVASQMFSDATLNHITNPGTGSPNRLLFVGAGGPPPGCPPATNATDVPIPDPGTAVSSISLTCTGNASATSTIQVDIIHNHIGNLIVDLVAPDGTVYNLHNRSGGGKKNIHTTYTRDLSSEAAAGTWQLRVQDAVSGNTGFIDSWTLDL